MTLANIGLDARFVIASHDFEADAEGAGGFVPIGAEHLETAYLACGTDVAADAGTDVVVANAY